MTTLSDVEVIPLEIAFRTPFLLSRGYVGAPGRPGQHVYLKLTTRDGEVGWGEARPMPTWSFETMETVCSTLAKHVAPILLDGDCSSIRSVRARIDRAITRSVSASQPFAISAVEQALFDLMGKESGMPLHRMLGGRLVDNMDLCYMISGDAESIATTAKNARRKGFTCFKIKITGDPERDASSLSEASHAVSDATIWADANQAYTPVSLRRLLGAIGDLTNIACLEQPVPTYDYFGLQRVARQSPIPVAADESIFTPYDMLRIGNMGAADLAVLKIAKSAILDTQRICAVADSFGVDLLGSGMTESGVGFAASIHVFSTIPVVLPVDTNGPQFLSDLLVEGLRIEDSRVVVPDGPGLGIRVDEEKLDDIRAEAPGA